MNTKNLFFGFEIQSLELHLAKAADDQSIIGQSREWCTSTSTGIEAFAYADADTTRTAYQKFQESKETRENLRPLNWDVDLFALKDSPDRVLC